MGLPLQSDFDSTLDLVRRLRRNVRKDPLVPTPKGGVQTNPAYVLLKDQELHLRGLARLLGPAHVEQEIQGEFKSALSHVRALMEEVENAPLAEGQRHAQTRNPIAVIMTCEQTHVRGCAALLQAAKASIPVGGDNEFEALFDEPV